MLIFSGTGEVTEAGGGDCSAVVTSGLIYHFCGPTLTGADNAEIATWAGSSSTGRDGTQATSANRPVKKLSVLNSKPGSLWDGSNDYLSLPTVTLHGDVTFLAVCRVTDNNPHTIFSNISASGAFQFRLFNKKPEIVISDVQAFGPISIGAMDGTSFYTAGARKAAGGSYSTFLNDTSSTGFVSGGGAAPTVAVNAMGGQSSGQYYSDYILEAMMWNRVLSDTEVDDERDRLQTDWAHY